MLDRERLVAERFRLVEEWAESGLRPGEFCEREGISPETLRKWRVKYEAATGRRLPRFSGGRGTTRTSKPKVSPEPPAPFLPLALTPAPSGESKDAPLVAEVVVADQTRVRVYEGFDPDQLTRLLEVVAR
jgi:transposase-like protein